MGPLVEQVAQTLAAGLTIGCIYGLLCVGLAFIFGIMRVINFAQGDLMMVGMYVAIAIGGVLPGLGLATPFIAALLAGPLLFAAGYALNRFLISRTTGLQAAGSSEAEAHQAQLILTLGVALILQNGALFLLGSTPESAPTPLSSSAWELPLLYDDFSAVFFNKARTIDAAIAILLAIGLFWFVRSTRAGKSLRAAAINPEAALYMGIDVTRAHHLAFGMGAGIAGVAGGADCHLLPGATLCRCRVHYRHVRGRRAGWHGQYRGRILGRHDDRACAAAFDPRAAVTAAERRHLRRVRADLAPAAARAVRP